MPSESKPTTSRPDSRRGSAARARTGRLGIAVLLAFVAGVFASSAAEAAVPPVHGPLPDPIHGFPLDHACGAATDSNGDIYVSNAGNDAVEVFAPNGDHLATIANSNDPCGLAVDTLGRLFVSEQGTGNVVRYEPNAYPLGGSPSYSAPTTIDSSGDAAGIAVDPWDNSIYVARGDEVAVYGAGGGLATVNEEQQIDVDAAGGAYTLTFDGQTTGPITWDASAATIQAELEALSNIGPGNVAVSMPNSGQYRVTFQGALAATDVPQLVSDSTLLVDGTAEVSTNTRGFSARIGDGDLTDATGVAIYTYDNPKGNEDEITRYLSVADSGSDEIKVWTGERLSGLSLHHTIDGSETPDGSFGFGLLGAQLTADSSNGHIFVYDSTHSNVDEFEAKGTFVTETDDPGFADAAPTGLAVYPHRNEIQEVTVSESASAGSYTLTFQGDQTAPIAWDADAAQIQAALEALPSIGVDGVRVALGASPFATPYGVTFSKALGGKDVPQLTVDTTGLTGSVTVRTLEQGIGPGRLYVGAGSGAGAKLLAFGPLAETSRPLLPPPLSKTLPDARAVTIDHDGYVYIGVGSAIHVYSPTGALVTEFAATATIKDLAVDSTGRVYAIEGVATPDTSPVFYYTPSPSPPTGSTTYTRSSAVLSGNTTPRNIAINLANDHLFVIRSGASPRLVEFDSAQNGSGVVTAQVCPAQFLTGTSGPNDLGVYAATGEIYMIGSTIRPLWVLDPSTCTFDAIVRGSGNPDFGSTNGWGGGSPAIAVDQSNGHVLVAKPGFPLIEHDASGAVVGRFPPTLTVGTAPFQVAIDNSEDATDGNVYVAYDDLAAGTFDVNAYGPLDYGGPPTAVTGAASNVDGGDATLNGTIDPRGSDVIDCHFEYATEAQFQIDEFDSATDADCVPDEPGIGSGTGAVAVEAELSGLNAATRYYYRLVAKNDKGLDEGDAVHFGPPVLTTKTAKPVHYTEATLRANIDPSGVATTYRFEYGSQGPCSANPCTQTALENLAAGAGPTDVIAPLFGLDDGTTYHFRAITENGALEVIGADQSFTTQLRPAAQNCPNAAFRTDLSASLPDCRAYELVTPADSGINPIKGIPEVNTHESFNHFPTVPRGPQSGDRLSFAVPLGLPGFDGTGALDFFRSDRGAGDHPVSGWTTNLVGASYEEAQGDVSSAFAGVSPDQNYGLTSSSGGSDPESIRSPGGFEDIGQGSLGSDPAAQGWYIGTNGQHAIFTSSEQLEPEAPPPSTTALYDRAAGSPDAEVISVQPDGSPFAAGQHATYLGANFDGTAVVFKVAGAMYVHRGGQTIQVAASPNTFAGISEDGERVFYIDIAHDLGTVPPPAGLFACDTEVGPCAGPGAQAPIAIAASNARFANVSHDGTGALFTSTSDLAPGATAGQTNLYHWDGDVAFVATLPAADFSDFFSNINRWVAGINTGTQGVGLGETPTRSTQDGDIFAFESRAQLTPYDNEGKRAIYRYDPAAAPGQQIICASCDPSGAAPSSDAIFENLGLTAYQTKISLIPNLADDGNRLVFQSADQILPEDANAVTDVYEWQAQGTGGCNQVSGCIALISSGQSDQRTELFAMSADGGDIFIETSEELVSADVPGTLSVYDARINGGLPRPSIADPCSGDTCQGNPTPPPDTPQPGSSNFESGNQGRDKTPAETSKKCKKKKKGKKCRKARNNAANGRTN